MGRNILEDDKRQTGSRNILKPEAPAPTQAPEPPVKATSNPAMSGLGQVGLAGGAPVDTAGLPKDVKSREEIFKNAPLPDYLKKILVENDSLDDYLRDVPFFGQFASSVSDTGEAAMGDIGADEYGARMGESASNLGRSTDDLVRATASGVTRGFADEISGSLDTKVFGGDLDENIDAQRARDAQIPTSIRLPGEIGGAMATIAAAAPALAGTSVGQGFAHLPRWLQAASVGSLEGGLFGAGHADGTPAERIPDATAGALTGGALGGGLSILGSLGRGGVNMIKNRVSPTSAADNRLSKAISDDLMTPKQVQSRLSRLGPQATISDAGGENVRGLARLTAGVPGPAKERAKSIFNNRAFTEGTRVQNALKGHTKAPEMFLSREDLVKAMKDKATPYYKRAYAAGPELRSNKLFELLNRKPGKDALKEAADLAGIEGKSIKMTPRGISTEAVDDFKAGLDSLIAQEKNEFTRELSKRGGKLTAYKNEVLREVDRLNPSYKAARDIYRGDAEIISAVDLGAKFKRMSAEELRRTLSVMTPAEQQAFRNGATKEILLDINKTGDGRSVAQKLGGNKEMREKMRALIPDAADFREFTRLLVQEGRFQQTRNTVLGGSQTFNKQAEALDAIGGVAGDVASGQGLATTLVRKGIDAVTRPNAQASRQLSPMLFNKNPTTNAETLQGLTPMQAAFKRRIADKLSVNQGLLSGVLANQQDR